MKPAFLLVFALAGAASAAGERARIVEVRPAHDAEHSSVEVIGDRPLSFTTMRLSAPPRVVVDVQDADVETRELEVGDGVVRRIASAAAGARTARVVIELAAEAEFEVHAEGERIAVRFARVGAAQGVADADTRASIPTVSLVGSKPAAGGAEEGKEPPAASDAGPAEEQVAAAPTTRKAREIAAARESARGANEVARKLDARKARSAQPAPPPAAPRPPPPAGRALAMAGSSPSITSIGFRPTDGGAVIVRSDRPLEASVSGEPGAVLLHLKEAGIPVANNRRALDTRFFDGAVQRVIPLPVAGGTDVRIEVRGRAEYQLEQSGSVLTVTFARP